MGRDNNNNAPQTSLNGSEQKVAFINHPLFWLPFSLGDNDGSNLAKLLIVLLRVMTDILSALALSMFSKVGISSCK
jgi:hypothetical protein